MTALFVQAAPEALPALLIEVAGAVTASNLPDYKAHALAVIGSINRELVTDQHFADAENAVKWCADVEARIVAAKQHAQSQMGSIDDLFRALDDIGAEARHARLELFNLVKARKETVRGEIVAGGITALREHVAALNTRLGKPYMPAVNADFAGAIKGKRTIESLKNAVDTTLVGAKIEVNAIADKIQANLGTLRELATDHAFLFFDAPQIVLRTHDDLTALVKNRIAGHQQKEAARIEAETARIRVEVEQQERAKADAQAKAAAVVTPAPAPEVVSPAEPEPEIVQVTTFTAPASEPQDGPAITLGQIGERLGFALQASFLAELGFTPLPRDKKRPAATLYSESDFPRICAALVAHINRVSALAS